MKKNPELIKQAWSNINDFGLGLFGSTSEGSGISLDDFNDLPEHLTQVNYKRFLEKDAWFPIDDCYVIDCETYFHNSKIRCVQVFDTRKKLVFFVIHGKIEEKARLRIEEEVKEKGYTIKFIERTSEFLMLEFVIRLLKARPKHVIGQNLAHFDLGIIHSKVKSNGKYKLTKDSTIIKENGKKRRFHFTNKIKFVGHVVGSGRGQRFLYFYYQVGKDKKTAPKFYIVDTMYLAFSLFLPSSLKELAVNSKFPKKETDYRLFEKEVLDYDETIYSIWDVLSIPDVYDYLKNIIINPTEKYLLINSKSSQQLNEHCWEKGHGTLAESYLNKFLGRINPNTPDFLSKYMGGITRAWSLGLHQPDKSKGEVCRQLDFTSAYPFSIVLQGIFDILAGNFKYYSNKLISEIEHFNKVYDSLIYSSTFILISQEMQNCIIETDESKTNGLVGLGFIRSFNEQVRVQDLEHSFSFLVCKRNEKVILTKAEIEMNKAISPDFLKRFKFHKIIDGMLPTTLTKTLEYIELFGDRLALKEREKLENIILREEIALKYILNAEYGKLAESIGEWFNLACASAITSFQRVQLFSLCIKAVKLRLKLLYSDTDSVYVIGKPEIINKLIIYGNELNPYPMKLFKIDNIKDEGEDILCFHSIKRKRYTKIFLDKKGKLIIKVKGENGNSDYRWRDVLFRLSIITNGSISLNEMNEHIKNQEFGFKIPEKDDYLKFFQSVYEEHQGEKLCDLIHGLDSKAIVTMMFNIHFQNSTNYVEGVYYNKIRKAWEEKTGEIAYVGCFFSINRDIKTTYKTKIKFTNEEMDDIELDGKVKFIFQNNNKKLIMKGTKLKIDGIVEKVINLNGLETIINNDVDEITIIQTCEGSFEPKKASEYNFNISKESYVSSWDDVPVVKNSTYYKLLTNKINLDTIVVKTRNQVPIWYLDDDIKRKVTNQSFQFPHNGKKYHFSLWDPGLFIKLRLKELPNEFPEVNKYLDGKINWNKDKELYEKFFPYLEFLKEADSKEYVNTHLFIVNVTRIECCARLNKFRLFCKQPTIFNIYRTIHKIGTTLQITLENMFKLRKIDIKIPRFSFISQLDVCQSTDEKFAYTFYKECWGKSFTKKSIGEFIQADFLSYMSLTAYHKRKSARNKIFYKNLTKEEREYFENEANAEEWRSEIKFKLNRNFYESLSYTYMLSLIKQEHFLEFVRNHQRIRAEKTSLFKLKSYISGKFRFNQKMCLILFNPFSIMSGEHFLKLMCETRNDIDQDHPPNILDGRGCRQPPPLQNLRFDGNEIKNYKKLDDNFSKEIVRKYNSRLRTSQDTIKWEWELKDLIIDSDFFLDEKMRSEVFQRF